MTSWLSLPKGGATARKRAPSYDCRRGWCWNGRDPDRSPSWARSHRYRWQPSKLLCSKRSVSKHVIDSRRGNFAEAVMVFHRSQGRGRGPERACWRSDPDGSFCSRNSVVSSRSASATSTKMRVFPFDLCATMRRSMSWRWMRSFMVTKN